MNYKVKTLALLLAVAAGNSARAQQATYAQGCKSYTFTGSNASGSGDITYQWYRDGQPISGATGKDYVLPLKQAYGENVEFKRGVMSSGCPGDISFSDIISLTFFGLKIDTLCWANTNVDAPNTFATQPDMYTQFYQWNRETAWATTGTVSGWNSTGDTSVTWTVNPCPAGWRLPRQPEYAALHNSGNTWANARTRGNTLAGYFYGPAHATCSLPSNMVGCIFMSAAGARRSADGAVSYRNTHGTYWMNQSSANGVYGYGLYFLNTGSDAAMTHDKADGFTIRCVQ